MPRFGYFRWTRHTGRGHLRFSQLDCKCINWRMFILLQTKLLNISILRKMRQNDTDSIQKHLYVFSQHIKLRPPLATCGLFIFDWSLLAAVKEFLEINKDTNMSITIFASILGNWSDVYLCCSFDTNWCTRTDATSNEFHHNSLFVLIVSF